MLKDTESLYTGEHEQSICSFSSFTLKKSNGKIAKEKTSQQRNGQRPKTEPQRNVVFITRRRSTRTPSLCSSSSVIVRRLRRGAELPAAFRFLFSGRIRWILRPRCGLRFLFSSKRSPQFQNQARPARAQET